MQRVPEDAYVSGKTERRKLNSIEVEKLRKVIRCQFKCFGDFYKLKCLLN